MRRISRGLVAAICSVLVAGAALVGAPSSSAATAPPTISVAPGSFSILVTWRGVAADATSLQVEQRWFSGTRRVWSAWAATSAEPSAGTVTLSGNNGALFEVRARSVHPDGVSEWSAVRQVRVGAPYAPSGVRVTAIAASTLRVSWTPPKTNGAAVIAYRVFHRSRVASQWTAWNTSWATPPRTSVDLKGLTNGRPYEAYVQAKNSRGYGAPSSIVAASPTSIFCAPSSTSVSPLTGLPSTSRRPLTAFKVDMYPVRAWPSAGTDSADEVIMEEVESGVTRMVALFQSRYPTRVGNLRSARETDVDLLKSYGKPLVAYSGSVTAVRDQLAAAGLPTVVEATAGSAFYRDQARAAEKGSTYSLFGLGDPVLKLSYARKAGTTQDLKRCYGPLPSGGQGVTMAEARLPNAGTAFRWNASARRFDVTYTKRTGGTTYANYPAVTDKGVRLRADNVVILNSDRETVRMHRVTVPVPKTSTLGTGTALVMRGGRAYDAVWTRATLTDPVVLKTTAGKPFPLAKGKTWIALATQERSVLVWTSSGKGYGPKVANRALPAWFRALFPSPK